MPRKTEDWTPSRQDQNWNLADGDQQYPTGRDAAIMHFNSELDRKDHTVADELQAASQGNIPCRDLSWTRQSALKTVYDTEDESHYHDELDPKSTAGKLFNALEASADHMTDRERAIVAGEIARQLHHPLANELLAAGLNVNEPLRDIMGGPVHHTLDMLGTRFRRNQNDMAEHLTTLEPDEFAATAEQLRSISRDTASAQARQAQDFPLIAANLTETGDWRDISQPQYKSELYQAVQEMVADHQWSRGHIREVTHQLAETLTAPLREEIEQLATQHTDGPKPESMIDYLLIRELITRSQISIGPLIHHEQTYMQGRQNLDDTLQEAREFAKHGTIPAPRNDGSTWNDRAMEALERVRNEAAQ